jgi:hypothetical protein
MDDANALRYLLDLVENEAALRRLPIERSVTGAHATLSLGAATVAISRKPRQLLIGLIGMPIAVPATPGDISPDACRAVVAPIIDQLEALRD